MTPDSTQNSFPWQELLRLPNRTHQQQGSLGKGQVKQGGGCSEGHPGANLLDDQERRESPEFVEDEHKRLSIIHI